MAILKDTVSMKILSIACLVIFFCFITTASIAEGANRVTTYRDSDGWKLKVDGKDFYVKGVVWGYVPKNENYSYSLWGKPDYYIKKVLDYEFGLMKKVGVNAFRSFSDIPPKWVTYIYEKYGIMTAINPLMGRYGALVGGSWRKNTDYSDSLTRKTLKDEVLKIVRKYKDVPGVLMFALGNESNYGLSWKSFEIEDLPVGEQNKKKARYLYSLFGEVITQGKKIDPNHPFTIVNGDIQYLDLIAEYGQDWDLLGVNAYRGVSFTNLWRDVKTKLDIPVLFFEFGADAFNAKDFAEDQVSQAYYLKSQWKEMYQKSSGHGEEGNSIGGFVFEWRDEWWKYKQTENLGRHDETASWANGGYKSDYVEGQNNMNEEWWGITSLGEINQDGVSTSKPRMAYDVLGEIWRINPYEGSVDSINRVIDNINMDVHQMRSEIRFLKDSKKRSDTFNIAGGRFEFDMLNKSLESDLERDGADGAEYDYGFMGFLDFEFKPTRNIKGDFTLNFIADASDSDFEFKYGDRVIDEEGGKAEKFELYSFQTSYEGNDFDLLGFYHVPRYHWGYKGDFFGLLRETTDMDGENGQDIWNAKAPYGVELIGKNFLDGLTIVTGPEVYWGANPKIITKYQFGKSNSYTFIHSEDFVRRSDSASGAEATGRRSRQTTIQGEFEFNSSTKLQIGGIISGTPKIGEKYDRIEDSDIILDEIKFEDTLGLKGKLSFSLFNITNNYLAFNYAGLVADGGEPLKEFGTQLPYSELGNKKEVEAGMLAQIKSFTIFPRVLYRENLVDANPSINPGITGTVLSPGIEPRNLDDDPFAVLDNRSARSAELYLTYDPTPSTPFYDWDNDIREDAEFAFNIGFTFIEYNTPTESELFYYEEGESNAPFGEGLKEEDVWLLKSKFVFNTSGQLKTIAKIEAGKEQPTGVSAESREYAGIEGKLVIADKHIISAGFKKDAWGPYDFERQFNLSYPEQIDMGYTMLLDKGKSEKNSSKIGIKVFYRTLDENSDGKFYQDGLNDSMSEIRTFFKYNLKSGG